MNTDKSVMKRGSTLFLRGVVLSIGFVVLALSVYVFPVAISGEDEGEYRPLLWSIYATVLPFYFALYQTLKLLHFIDKNIAFSGVSVKALGYIKYCAAIVGTLYTVSLPYFYYMADREDAPGVMVIGLIFAFAPIVIAVFAAVLQKLLQNAIDIKAENDLTV